MISIEKIIYIIVVIGTFSGIVKFFNVKILNNDLKNNKKSDIKNNDDIKQDEIIKNSNELALIGYMFKGIGGAMLVPLFLNLFNSKILSNLVSSNDPIEKASKMISSSDTEIFNTLVRTLSDIHPKDENILIFAGMCFIFGYWSDIVFLTISTKFFDQVNKNTKNIKDEKEKHEQDTRDIVEVVSDVMNKNNNLRNNNVKRVDEGILSNEDEILEKIDTIEELSSLKGSLDNEIKNNFDKIIRDLKNQNKLKEIAVGGKKFIKKI